MEGLSKEDFVRMDGEEHYFLVVLMEVGGRFESLLNKNEAFRINPHEPRNPFRWMVID